MKKTLLIASTALLLCSGAVLAAGSQAAVAPAAASNGSGFYVGAEGGVALVKGKPSGDAKDVSDYLKTGFNVDVHAGYAFGNGFSAEAAISYQKHTTKDEVQAGYLYSWNYMANGYYNFALGDGITPFVGVGVGLAHFGVHAEKTSDTFSNNHFAFQGIVGVSYKLNQNFSVAIDYHIMKMTGKTTIDGNSDDYANKLLFHSINLGVNYSF